MVARVFSHYLSHTAVQEVGRTGVVLCHGTGGEAEVPEISDLPSITQVIQGNSLPPHQGF